MNKMNSILMHNLRQVLKNEQWKGLDIKNEQLVDTLLASKDGELFYLGQMIKEALDMTLNGVKTDYRHYENSNMNKENK
tara:strand:- start:304 stop:540 length:237 start_codon:yes stop_codon:yes gene_type:complete